LGCVRASVGAREKGSGGYRLENCLMKGVLFADVRRREEESMIVCGPGQTKRVRSRTHVMTSVGGRIYG